MKSSVPVSVRFSFPEVLEGSDYGVVVQFMKREATTKAARLKSAVARISYRPSSFSKPRPSCFSR